MHRLRKALLAVKKVYAGMNRRRALDYVLVFCLFILYLYTLSLVALVVFLIVWLFVLSNAGSRQDHRLNN